MSVIVAAGLMGGLALMIAQMAKQQHWIQKKAETGTEVVALSRRILHTLYDGNACIQTLGSGTAIRPGTPLSVNAIKNKSGRDMIVTGGTYGNRLLKVSSIKVVNPVVNGDTAEAKLEVVMERTSRAYTGQKRVTKNFDLTLNLDPSASFPTLVGCATGGGELIAMCNALGGNWGSGKCTLAPAPSAASGTGSCGVGEAMTGVDGNGDAICTSLSAGQAMAPGVPPGCFPKKSEAVYKLFGNRLPPLTEYWHAARTASSSSGPQRRLVEAVPCPASHSVERQLMQSCTTSNSTTIVCILNTFCCLQ